MSSRSQTRPDALVIEDAHSILRNTLRFVEPVPRHVEEHPTWIPLWKDYHHPSVPLQTHELVEIRGTQDYLYVKERYLDATDGYALIVRGFRLARLHQIVPGVGRKWSTNELVALQVIRPGLQKSRNLYLETCSGHQLVVASHKRIVFTNSLPLPLGTAASVARNHPFRKQPPTDVLVCRKISIRTDAFRNRKWELGIPIIRTLTEEEADWDFSVSHQKIYDWERKIRSLTNGIHEQSRYTFVDCFSGGGFTTQGAKDAGLDVRIAFDNDAKAIATYKRNHADVNPIHCDFAEFISLYGSTFMPDILHISLPCQPYSPAHTRPGCNDDSNTAMTFSIDGFLSKFRPRMVTLEQTHGFTRESFKLWRLAVVAQLIDNDYDVVSKIVNLAGLGEATTRKRLLTIAAAPGEELAFPRQTHHTSLLETSPTLRPYVSIARCLRQIDHMHPDHQHKRYLQVPVRAIDPWTNQVGTLTCGRDKKAQKNIHYNGTRLWTIHEMMLFQGAPRTFHMGQNTGITAQLRQIGNAFPCKSAAAVFRACRDALARTDARYGHALARDPNVVDPIDEDEQGHLSGLTFIEQDEVVDDFIDLTSIGDEDEEDDFIDLTNLTLATAFGRSDDVIILD